MNYLQFWSGQGPKTTHEKDGESSASACHEKKPIKTKRCEKYRLIIAKNKYMHQFLAILGKLDLTLIFETGKIQAYRGIATREWGVPQLTNGYLLI